MGCQHYDVFLVTWVKVIESALEDLQLAFKDVVLNLQLRGFTPDTLQEIANAPLEVGHVVICLKSNSPVGRDKAVASFYPLVAGTNWSQRDNMHVVVGSSVRRQSQALEV